MVIKARLSSIELGPCPLCKEFTIDGIDNFLESARHLQDVHGLICLHVGQESIDAEKQPFQTTVALFGPA
jgi:hypothetical protein